MSLPSHDSGDVAPARRIERRIRSHFVASAAHAMRRTLINYAKMKKRHKRGGDVAHIAVEDADWLVAHARAGSRDDDSVRAGLTGARPRI